MTTWTYESLKEAGHIIFECIAGSHAYGTAIETSDIDVRYVYVLPLDNMLGVDYQRIINNASNDVTGYELGRFLQLLGVGNPTVLELIDMPEDSVVCQHPVYGELLAHRQKFITKKLRKSLGGYVDQQLEKASGLNKLMNKEKAQVVRKTPLDFCQVANPRGGGSQTFTQFLRTVNQNTGQLITQQHFGAVSLPHMKNAYELFFSPDPGCHWTGGLVNEQGTSNALRVVSVPKGTVPIRVLSYDQDAYSQHCKDYKKYQDWLKNRNTARYVQTTAEGQQIDAKNMMHCRRLLDMAREIASGQGLHVRRPNREELLAIRRGEVSLGELFQHAQAELKELDTLFATADLPEETDPQLVAHLILSLRLTFYVQRGVTLVELRQQALALA